MSLVNCISCQSRINFCEVSGDDCRRMAASRKKQDEKNLKTLRELGAVSSNKYCFDCNQRGPTYVNVTIGSFVCTKCSGILRGITPPHRVKSISMAIFTVDEVELLRNRGNDYCRRVWLGLFEGTPPTHSGDEQIVRDFMVDKYERRRYYLEPGASSPAPNPSTMASIPRENGNIPPMRPLNQLLSDPKPVVRLVNGTTNGNHHNYNNGTIGVTSHRNRPDVQGKIGATDFIADFDKADIFSSGNNNVQNQKNGSFANFDNNPVFTNHNNASAAAGMPTPAALNNLSNQQYHQQQQQQNNSHQQRNQMKIAQHSAPMVDKYAALKDLDNALKTQSTLDWSTSGSNGSLYSSPTPNGSVYSSPSPQNSVFGSPSQGQFISAFTTAENGSGSNYSNPFNSAGGNCGINWTMNGNGLQHHQPQQQNNQPFANPFHDTAKVNGFSPNFAAFPVNAMSVNGSTNQAWTPNPFKVGATANINSNNPFL